MCTLFFSLTFDYSRKEEEGGKLKETAGRKESTFKGKKKTSCAERRKLKHIRVMRGVWEGTKFYQQLQNFFNKNKKERRQIQNKISCSQRRGQILSWGWSTFTAAASWYLFAVNRAAWALQDAGLHLESSSVLKGFLCGADGRNQYLQSSEVDR